MRGLLTFVTMVLLHVSMKAQIMWQLKGDTVVTWQYREGDEFTENKINKNYWRYSGSVRSIYSNKEQQYYTDGDNHQFTDGLLILNAKKERVERRVVDWKNDQDSVFGRGGYYGKNKRVFEYTAGYLQTEEKYRYGYYEIKFRMPSKPGFWPAFWLFGGNGAEEIDAMELKTEKRNQIHVGRHSSNSDQNYFRYRLRKRVWGDWIKFKGDLTTGFHVVGVEWDTSSVKYFLNGECIAHSNVTIYQPKKIILNIAVPSNGPFKPGPNDTVLNSGNFEIDYLRIWDKKPVASEKSGLVSKSTSNEPLRKIENTALKSRDKFIYGTKADHKNEGITVEFMRLREGCAVLTVLGQTEDEQGSYIIQDQNQQVLLQGKFVYGETQIIYKAPQGENLSIEIEWKGKKQKYFFQN